VKELEMTFPVAACIQRRFSLSQEEAVYRTRQKSSPRCTEQGEPVDPCRGAQDRVLQYFFGSIYFS
jgi:hypothetical protein